MIRMLHLIAIVVCTPAVAADVTPDATPEGVEPFDVRFRDRFGNDGLDFLQTRGGALGLDDAEIQLLAEAAAQGATGLRMGNSPDEVRVYRDFDPRLREENVSVYVRYAGRNQARAFLELAYEDDTRAPFRFGVDEDGTMVLSSPDLDRDGPPNVRFEPGWYDLTVHRQGYQVEIYVGERRLARWLDREPWKRVSLVRTGAADRYAWFDDLRVYTGPPWFEENERIVASRGERRMMVGLRGVSSWDDAGGPERKEVRSFELEWSGNVSPSTRMGVQLGRREILASSDVLLVGGMFEQKVVSTDLFIRGELGFAQSGDDDEPMAWFGAALGYEWRVLPRLSVVPSVGLRRMLHSLATIDMVPVALTVRYQFLGPVAGSDPPAPDSR